MEGVTLEQILAIQQAIRNLRRYIREDPEAVAFRDRVAVAKVLAESQGEDRDAWNVHNTLLDGYRRSVITKFANLYRCHSKIFLAVLDGNHEDEIDDVLATLVKLRRGEISEGAAINHGAAIVKEKGHLPDGFFNQMPET